MSAVRILMGLLFIASSMTAQAAGRSENRFGSIWIDGKKAGQIHYTIVYGDGGDVETLRTRASLSILGVKLFNFDQTLHETWRHGCAACAGAPTTTARSTTPCSTAAPTATWQQ